MKDQDNSFYNEVIENMKQVVECDESMGNVLGLLGRSVVSSSGSLAQIETLQDELDLLLEED